MSSYEIEHNVPNATTQAAPKRTRPNLETFYTSLEHVDTSSVQNANALPTPGDVAAAYRLLGQSMEALMTDNPNSALRDHLLETISQFVEAPPTRPKGLPAAFIDGLDRVPKKALRKDDECPICGIAFLEDEYPLVVRLPCNDKHMFDLDCIQPWFKLNSTCPLDRKDLSVRKQPLPPPPKSEDEEEYDDMYG